MKYEKRFFDCEFRVTNSGRKLVGYAAVFDTLSENLGGFRERIRLGAFGDTLQTADVRALINHDSNYVLGRTTAGTLSLSEDSTGLKTEILLPNTTFANDLRESVSRQDISQMSFGFNVVKDSWANENGQEVRTLEKVDLVDVSVVTFPAYPDTKAQIRFKEGYKTMNIQELRNKRASLWEEMKRLNDIGTLNAEQQGQYDRMDTDFEKLTRDIDLTERGEFLSQSQRGPTKPDLTSDYQTREQTPPFPMRTGEIRVFQPGTYKDKVNSVMTETESRDFNDYLKRGLSGLTSAQRQRFEARALQLDSDTQAGYVVAPEQFVNQFIASLFDSVFVRRYSTVIQCPNAHSLGAPALDTDVGDPEWTADIKAGSDDSDMSFEKRQLYPHPLARRIRVSNSLIRRNPQAGDFVKSRLSNKFAIVEENNFLNGTGVNSPLGIFEVSDMGISTSRDVSTGNTTTSIKGDGLIEAKYALKSQYRRSARWIFHRDAVKQIRKLKDGEGGYIWRMGLSSDRPDTILDLPFDESEYCPSTFTTGLYVGALCNWEYYWIADALDMQIQVLDQLYAETNRIGYIGRKETDGMPVLEEAFVRVKLA